MRRSAWIFLAAILLPSLVLAFLAVRSARDQQVILQHQQAIISQDITDALAKKVQDEVDRTRAGFVQATDQLLQSYDSTYLVATDFNSHLLNRWDMADVGFAVDLRGNIYSPRTRDGTRALTFLSENDPFLTNREFAEVFPQMAGKESSIVYAQREAVSDVNAPPVSQELNPALQQALHSSQPSQQAEQAVNRSNENQGETRNKQRNTEQSPLLQPQRGLPQQGGIANQSPVLSNQPQSQAVNPAAQEQQAQQQSLEPSQKGNPSKQAKVSRKVEPIADFGQQSVSNSIAEQSDFRRVIGNESSGALARFLEDKLRLMVWYRPRFGSMVFGAQIIQQKLVENLKPLLESPDLKKSGNGSAAYCLAILDDRGKPVLLSKPGFTADWKHPFVASEIGEALPHWEAALYLLDPGQINRSASTLRLALALIVAVLMAAILLGGWLMAADVRRQMLLAQQKTDFVSNVSHELKTPLTSIRMFADMLAEGRVNEQERQRNYLRIIAAESARLTRLINNVLDFARMERGAPSGERRPCDLVDVANEVVNTCRPHLEAVGIPLTLEVEAEELPLHADRDALAQIMLNLISNAEKYGGKEILVRVRRGGLGGSLLSKEVRDTVSYSSLRDERLPKGPRFASESLDADTGSGSFSAKMTHSPAFGCVDVLDRGPGIPPKKRETIFEPFQRLDDSLASGVTGSGLGLTLARRMARAHGGDVTYTPRPDGGSCFTLTIPLQALVKTT
jgi:signal transduction histidine kinase/HAMP domain-containing protein